VPVLAGLSFAPRAQARPATADPDSVYFAGDAGGALALLETRLASAPDDYESSWKATRAAVSAGLLAKTGDEQRSYYRRGVEHGTNATRLRPDGVDGLYWLAACEGRLSFLLAPGGAARAGQDVYDLSSRVLALDSLHAGANDALGKLYARLMELSAVQRFVARAFLRKETIRQASWANAERYLARAIELDPMWMTPHVDLGEVYLYQGRFDAAATELQRGLDLPVRHPGERDYRDHATWLVWYARQHRKP
jgi:tetratricopeptide (TPR) repeat protein